MKVNFPVHFEETTVTICPYVCAHAFGKVLCGDKDREHTVAVKQLAAIGLAAKRRERRSSHCKRWVDMWIGLDLTWLRIRCVK